VLKSIIYRILLLINSLIPKKRSWFLFLSSPDFSGNPKALFDYLLKEYPEFDYKWIVSDPRTSEKLKSRGIQSAQEKSFKALLWFFLSKTIVTSTLHRAKIKTKKQIYVNLWHGLPLKVIGNMCPKHLRVKTADLKGPNCITISNSQTTTTLLAACLNVTPESMYISGQPRCDELFNPMDRVKLTDCLGFNELDIAKIVIHMPTYRECLGTDKNLSNPFGFDGFDLNQWYQFLEKNRILFICKLHPLERIPFVKSDENKGCKHFVIFNESFLREQESDLYRLIGCSDLLVTDYSSVYFDYLLLDRSIIFTPTDLEEYKRERGFLLEPYDFWTPGPKARNQGELQKEIIMCLDNPSYFKEERERVADIIHVHRDKFSCQRVSEVVLNRILISDKK